MLKFAAIALLLVLAAFDWMRPAAAQISTRIYHAVVIDTYRAVVHPLTSRLTYCPFRPTCSHYSEIAMQKHGFVKGIALTVWRLVRCGPWTKAGTPDPVP